MISHPLVSVIIPTYSRPTRIVRAIISALNQTYQPLEIIVVDDNGLGSEKQIATYKVLEILIEKHNIIYLTNEKNSGACAARNYGFRKSKGEYLCFLDDDDVMDSTIIAKLIHKYTTSKYGDLGFTYSWIDVIGLDNSITSVHKATIKGDIYNSILYRYDISGNSGCWLIRRKVFESVGRFDEHLPSFQDYDLALRITKNYSVDYVGEILLHIYEDNTDRISTNIKSKLDGDRIFFRKHLPATPGIMRKKFTSEHFRRIGSYYFELGGMRFQAILNYIHSIFMHPFNISTWKNLLPLFLWSSNIFSVNS